MGMIDPMRTAKAAFAIIFATLVLGNVEADYMPKPRLILLGGTGKKKLHFASKAIPLYYYDHRKELFFSLHLGLLQQKLRILRYNYHTIPSHLGAGFSHSDLLFFYIV